MVVWEGHLQGAGPQGMKGANEAKILEDSGAEAGKSLVNSRCRRRLGEDIATRS